MSFSSLSSIGRLITLKPVTIATEPYTGQILLIGGGGGGSSGPGGAGQAQLNNSFSFTPNTTYTFAIGTGGTGFVDTSTHATTGTSTTLTFDSTTITAFFGGCGGFNLTGSQNSANVNGCSGGGAIC